MDTVDARPSRLNAAVAVAVALLSTVMGIGQYEKLAAGQAQKKEELRQSALVDQQNDDALNYRDDQFDLSDAAIAISISLLAVASLTQIWWLFALAMLPASFGTVMGFAGLAGWKFHRDLLARLLS